MHESLRREVEQSKAESRTSLALRNFVFGVLDEALREHYGENYSDRCFQSSMAINEVLEFLGIGCKLWSGHVCMARVTEIEEGRGIRCSWAGFWGDDTHSWVFNDYDELIDLTISHLHQHPVNSSEDDLPIPAVWWDDMDRWPPTMIYLPSGSPVADFSPEETQDTARFLEIVREKIRSKSEIDLVPSYQDVILTGPDALNLLCEAGHPWVLGSKGAIGLEYPQWVQNRIDELRRGR